VSNSYETAYAGNSNLLFRKLSSILIVIIRSGLPDRQHFLFFWRLYDLAVGKRNPSGVGRDGLVPRDRGRSGREFTYMGRLTWYREALENLGFPSLVRLQINEKLGTQSSRLTSKYLYHPVYGAAPAIFLFSTRFLWDENITAWTISNRLD
jgi:hypothetical protein